MGGMPVHGWAPFTHSFTQLFTPRVNIAPICILGKSKDTGVSEGSPCGHGENINIAFVVELLTINLLKFGKRIIPNGPHVRLLQRQTHMCLEKLLEKTLCKNFLSNPIIIML